MNGYFTNMTAIGQWKSVQTTSRIFTHPVELGINQPASFNAIAVSQNPNGVIREYNWTWGSGLDSDTRQSYSWNATPSPNAR